VSYADTPYTAPSPDFKRGDKVKVVVTLGLGPYRKVKRGRVGIVEAVYWEPGRMPHIFVRFGARTGSIWAQNCFKKLED
jgi:hypothetical protein